MHRVGLTHALNLLRVGTAQSGHLWRKADRAYSTAGHNADDIAILGGGITGIAAAYYLTQRMPRAKITIYEAKDRLGGWLSSKRVPVKNGSVVFEAGPRTLRPHNNGVLAARLIQELDLMDETIFTLKSSPAASSRYLYYPDHLVRMPNPTFGLWQNTKTVLTEPAFANALWSFMREAFVKRRDASVQDESCGDFFSRRIGKTSVDRLLSGVLHGIYAGDPYQLSARSLFPRQWRDELVSGSLFSGLLSGRRHGPLLTKREYEFSREMAAVAFNPDLRHALLFTSVFTFRDGIGLLVDRLARKLWEHGSIDVKTSTPVKSIRLADDEQGIEIKEEGSQAPKTFGHVISTLAPSHLTSLAGGAEPMIPKVPSVTVMTVNLYFPNVENLPPGLAELPHGEMRAPGFGYLIPLATPFEQNPERALGVVFDNAYSPQTTGSREVDPETLESVKQARGAHGLVDVNGFSWHNFPNKPVTQDDLRRIGTKVTVMLGGHWWDGWPSFPDEAQAVKMARAVLERHLHITQEPEAWQVNLQRDCIPQYTVGHEDRMMTAHDNISRGYKGRLRVAGNWISGVGVNDCLRSAWDVVGNLRDGKSGTGLEHVGHDEWVVIQKAE